MHETEYPAHDWADHLRYGAGTFAGNDITYSGGLATFQSIYGTAKGSHSVTGTRIICESDSAGQFVVICSLSGCQRVHKRDDVLGTINTLFTH